MVVVSAHNWGPSVERRFGVPRPDEAAVHRCLSHTFETITTTSPNQLCACSSSPDIAMDPHDALRRACERSETYPRNLFGQSNLADRLCEILDKQSQGLFSANACSINFVQLLDGDYDFDDEWAEQLRTFLDGGFNDPKCRFIFLETDEGGVMRCSKSQLLYILSYHQVMPLFLDFIIPSGPRGFQSADYTGIRQHDTLFDSYEKRPRIRSLGRSGASIRHCFALQIPIAPAHGGDQWRVRQTAVYYSFDLVTGRALWLVKDGGSDLGARLRRLAFQSDSFLAQHCSDVTTSFCASLQTHLEIMSWAAESWSGYARHLCAVADRLALPEEVAVGLGRGAAVGEKTAGDGGAWELVAPRLHKVEEAMHGIRQNGTVLKVLGDRLAKVMHNSEMSTRMREASHYHSNRVSEQAQGAQTELELRRSDLERAHSRLVGELKAQQHKARLASLQMQEMARKSQVEKLCIDIITLVTLVFLPGTFVATHFMVNEQTVSRDSPHSFPSETPRPAYQASTWMLLLVFATLVTYAAMVTQRRHRPRWPRNWKWAQNGAEYGR
ncbi:hypothetical protein GQ53DRAFT_742487 [Thozetella sp. PMI_491]|nr:hypothetical protein GQ53DRAFT_742487 [Thozetella sp. PMI_491]